MTKCTIIIPTYNRPNYLMRLLDYYNKYGREFNIIIADASSNENKKLNKKNISLFPNLKIIYLDDYPSKINAYYKICDALNRVNTKYSVLCADDDFITPNGINKSVDFLEKNSDFTVAHGYYISFYLKNNKNFFWIPFSDRKSITFSEPKSRLIFYLLNPYTTPSFYGVHKTKYLKWSFKELIKFTDESIFSEVLLRALEVIYGKIKCLDLMYGAREIAVPQRERALTKNFMDFIKEGTYDKQYIKLRECLSTHLSKRSSWSMEESKKLIDNDMLSFLKKVYKKNHSEPMIKVTKFLNKLRLPSWIDEKIRELYGDLCFIKKVRMNTFWKSIDKPSSKYYDDFNKIRNHILLHSQNK